MRTTLLVLLLGIVGCGSGDSASLPSCRAAMEHFYHSGCGYVSLSDGRRLSVDEAIDHCEDTISRTPNACHGELGAWLSCNEATPALAMSADDCDCFDERLALLSCMTDQSAVPGEEPISRIDIE